MSAWTVFPLSPLLIKGLAAQGFNEPTEIQKRVLPVAISYQKVPAEGSSDR